MNKQQWYGKVNSTFFSDVNAKIGGNFLRSSVSCSFKPSNRDRPVVGSSVMPVRERSLKCRAMSISPSKCLRLKLKEQTLLSFVVKLTDETLLMDGFLNTYSCLMNDMPAKVSIERRLSSKLSFSSL